MLQLTQSDATASPASQPITPDSINLPSSKPDDITHLLGTT